ncbi:MAG: hypothetical protein WC048_19085 [Rhizobium sp.]
MNAPDLQRNSSSTPDCSGVEFGESADGFPVARIGDTVLAMIPFTDGGGFLASAWRVQRPLSELERADFSGHDGRLADETAFRERVFEMAGHKRELAALRRVQTRMSSSTPWGSSQLATIYAEGVVSHTTAGHGGFHLTAERNALIHPMLRKDLPWYEEDAEWAIVALTFPELFTAYERKCADETIRGSWPDAWEKIFGRELRPGESRTKDRREFERQHAGDWIVISAILSNHHPGMTEVVATIGGARSDRADERRFLVPSAEYTDRGSFGFVIDDARHAGYDGPSSFIGWQARRKAR